MASLLGAKIQAGFGVALVILGILGAVLYWQAGHFREDAQWVAHTHAVLAKLATVLAQVEEVETGQRGYLLTGVASFLEPYNAAVPTLAQTLQELRALTADNPHQQGRLDALAPLLAEFTTAAAVTVAVRQTEGIEAAQWAVVIGQGKQRMEALRWLLGEMAAEERALLQKREVQTAMNARRTTWIIVLGSLATLGLVVTASRRLQRELAGRMQAEEALRQANDVLDQRVQERTAAFASVNETLQTEITERVQAEEALRASEARYRLLFDANPHPMWVYDLDALTILAINEAAVQAYGYSRDEFLAMTIKDLRLPEDIPALLTDLARLPAGYDCPDTWRHRKKDGTLIDVDVSSNGIRFGGRPARLVLAQDVTARTRAEAALRRYAERLELLHKIDQALIAEEAPEAIAGAVIQPLRELLGVPRAIVNIFDLAADNVEWLAAAGRHRVHIGPGVHYSMQFMGDVEALRRGEPQVIDTHALPPGPEVDALLASGVHMYMVVPMLAGGDLIGAISFGGAPGPFPDEQVSIAREVADQLAVALQQARLHAQVQRHAAELEGRVAERQRAEARVLQQLARLALLHQITRAIGERQDLHSIFLVILRHLEQDLPVAFACLCLGTPGSDTVTVMAVGPGSQTFAPTVGLAEQEVVSLDQMGLCACVDGQTVSVLDTTEESTPLLQRCAQAGLRSLIATPLLVEDSISGLLLVARREPQGFSSGEGEFLRQLSEHVALAAHHVSLYVQLQQAYDDLHQSQQVVMQQERLRALGQMASGIAHDINNAISPITLYVESLLASDTTLSPRAREYLSTVQQAAHDVAHTVARLREFYRQPVDSPEARPVDLNQIIPQVVELTRAKWRDEPQRLGMTIAVHTALQEEGLPPILGIESELREALINLIFNAVDAMPQGGSLTLQTRATLTAVVLEVIDTGIGMDEVTRQRCLEPFYTTKDTRGTGLGLAMVYGVTERHAAQIVIESAVGQGTTVRLLFPVALCQGETDDQFADVVESTHPLRMLIVDDDPLLRRLLQDVLQTEGHVVTVVEGGRIGLKALQVAQERQEPFDVVITDLGMPEMDGREVARRVKHVAPDTPVILLTGWGQALQQEGSLPPHVDLLLSKPPGLRELRAALRAVARPAGRKDNHGNT